MMTDMETSLSKNLDAQLWKSCFHNVIERFRELDKQLTDNNSVKKCIETVIEDVRRNIYLAIFNLKQTHNMLSYYIQGYILFLQNKDIYEKKLSKTRNTHFFLAN